MEIAIFLVQHTNFLWTGHMHRRTAHIHKQNKIIQLMDSACCIDDKSEILKKTKQNNNSTPHKIESKLDSFNSANASF